MLGGISPATVTSLIEYWQGTGALEAVNLTLAWVIGSYRRLLEPLGTVIGGRARYYEQAAVA